MSVSVRVVPLYQRDRSIGAAQARGAAPPAGTRSGGPTASFPGAAVLQQDVRTELAPSSPSVEQCGAALSITSRDVGAVLERRGDSQEFLLRFWKRGKKATTHNEIETIVKTLVSVSVKQIH